MNHQLPQPVPPVDAFYEWLLSDAPAAQRERARRRSRNAAQDDRERAQVRVWCRRTLDNHAAPAHLRDLAEVMQRLVSRGVARDLGKASVPDEEWVRRERRQYEASRRVAGDRDYRYPARYLGPDAADQPVPDERVPVTALKPGHRVRLGPSEPPAVVVDVEACGHRVLVATPDGQRRYPNSAWQFRVRDERYMPDVVREVSNVPSRPLGHHPSGISLER